MGGEDDVRQQARAQRLDGPHAEQRQVTGLLGRFQLRDVVDQLRQLGLRERRGVERQRIAGGILQVPLDPHGTEQEETNSHRRRQLQGIGYGAGLSRSRHDGAGRAPGQLGGPPARVTDREAHALVGRIGPQVHDASGVAFQVDLERVVARVLVDARRIAFVSGRVVEPRLREGEIRPHGVLRGRLGHE